MENVMNKIEKVLTKFHYQATTAVDIDGERHFMNEAQVRALQILCKEAIENGTFDEFASRVIVYTSNDAKHVNRFRKHDAKFVDCFEGLYSCNSDMAFELL